MTDEKLIAMANQVAAFFQAYPPDDGAKGVADHLKAFWTPKMCRDLSGYVMAGVVGIHPIVQCAMLGGPDTVARKRPIAKQLDGPRELGQLASDAG